MVKKSSRGSRKNTTLNKKIQARKLDVLQVHKAALNQAMSDGYFIQDKSGKITEANPAALKMLGLKIEDVRGKSVQDSNFLRLREDGTPFLLEEHPSVLALKSKKPVRNVIMGIIRGAEKPLWLRINAYPFLNGKEYEVLTSFSDVSVLVETKNETRFILDRLKLGVWSFDFKGKVLEGDDAIYRMYGIKRHKIKDAYSAWLKVLTPESRELLDDALTKVISGEKEYDVTFEVKMPQGSRYIGTKGTLVRRSDASPLKLYGISWDRTTEVKKEKIDKASTKIDQILSKLTIEGEISESVKKVLEVACNASEFRSCKLWENQLNKNNLISTLTIENAKAIPNKKNTGRDALSTASEGSLPLQSLSLSEIIYVEKPLEGLQQAGESNIAAGAVFSVLALPLTFGEENLGVLEFWSPQRCELTPEARDFFVSISVRLTQILLNHRNRTRAISNAKLATLGEMSAGVAHEINNPLAIILGNLHLIKNRELTEEKKAIKLEQIQSASNRILKIVQGLKKFSRTSQGPQFSVHTVKALIQNSVTLVESVSFRKDISFKVEIDPSLEILCDGVQIEQVLVNLISNSVYAIKNLEERWISIKASKEPSGEILIKVMDSGSGISTELESKLFQPFFTTKPVGEGTGLGLSISRGILLDHGARIGINRSTKHTCFDLFFPPISHEVLAQIKKVA